MKVTISWDAASVKLYLNGNLVQVSSYSRGASNWTAASTFDLGAYEYLTYGAYYGSDDAIADFTVMGPPAPSNNPQPAVSVIAPANGTSVNKTVTVSANATDALGITSVQFLLDGAGLGTATAGTGSTYSINWDTTTAANGPHVLKAVATDTGGYSTTSSAILVITPGGPVPLTLQPCASSGQVGVPYNSSLVATGGTPPYQFSISSGSLPGGLTLNSSTGAITGTPMTAGTFSFTATVSDSTSPTPQTVNSNTSTVIAPALAALTLQSSASSGQVGVAYSSALVASGGTPPYQFSISSGSLPGGLTLNRSTGAITGTPTASGTFNITATVTDSTTPTPQTVNSNTSITIAPPPALTLQPPAANGQVGVVFNSPLVASGGHAALSLLHHFRFVTRRADSQYRHRSRSPAHPQRPELLTSLLR